MFKLHENNFHGSEDELVKLFIKKYEDRELIFGDNFIKGEYFEQVSIPQIRRISDLIIVCGERRIINIEFKLGDWNCLVNQCSDHLKWADYSYACVPINFLRVYPKDFCKILIAKGIGLVVGSNETFFEVFRAKHNTYKNGKSKELRNIVLRKLKPIKAQFELFENAK